jgi:hypothetical protein
MDCNCLVNHGDCQYSLLFPDDGTLKCTETRRTRIQITYITESVSKVVYNVRFFLQICLVHTRHC